MTCHKCDSIAVKFGFQNGHQRYRCKICRKVFDSIPERPLDSLRVPLDKATQVLNLIVEGVGIRACERLTGVNRNTVLAILEVAGEKCARLLDARVRGLSVEQVQADEIWNFTHSKQINAKDPEHGDTYTFLALDKKSKLIISHYVGKRDEAGAYALISDLKKRVATHIQLTCDGFRSYRPAVFAAFGLQIDFAQLIKQYANPLEPKAQRRYSPSYCVGARRVRRIGYPIRSEISTSHVERTNLNVRLFNRRFTRLTLGFSKKLANLKHSVALLIAYQNFCRKHAAHGQTPAVAAGLTDHTWTIEELLTG